MAPVEPKKADSFHIEESENESFAAESTNSAEAPDRISIGDGILQSYFIVRSFNLFGKNVCLDTIMTYYKYSRIDFLLLWAKWRPQSSNCNAVFTNLQCSLH